MKKIIARLLLSLIFVCISGIFMGIYAQPLFQLRGYVCDSADLLFPEQEQQLVADIQEFDSLTHIEIGIATVSNLSGLSIEAFTLSVAKTWASEMGDDKNRILLLVAPNERKARIEVSVGLQARLTQSVAENIMQGDIIPQFKEQRMDEGIITGTYSIMRHLDESAFSIMKSTIERAEARHAQSRENILGSLLGLGIGLVVVGIVFLVMWMSRKRKLRNENLLFLSNLERQFENLKLVHAKAQATLIALSEYNPRSVWSRVKSDFDSINVLNMEEQLKQISVKCHGLWFPTELKEQLDQLRIWIAKSMNSYIRVEEKSLEVKRAKAKGKELLEILPTRIKALRKGVQHRNVTESTHAKWKRASDQFDRVSAGTQGVSETLVCWITVYSHLNEISDDLSKVDTAIALDKFIAVNAPTEVPKLFKKLPERLRELKTKNLSKKGVISLESAEQKYNDANVLSQQDSTNWVMLYLLLDEANSLCGTAEHAISHSSSSYSSSSSSHSIPDSSYMNSYDSGGGGTFDGGGGATGNW